MLSGCRDGPSVETDAITPVNVPEDVRITRKRKKLADSLIEATRQRSDKPNACRNPTDTSSVYMEQSIASVRNGNIYVLWSAPIDVLKTLNQRLTFREVKSRGEVLAQSVEAKRAGNGRQNGDVSDMDGMTSGGTGIDST